MRQLSEIALSQSQRQALAEIQQRLFEEFEVEDLILFGSMARGEADEESDLDLLVLTARPFTRVARHEITDLVFEVNLRFDTNFSTLVVDRSSWESGVVSVLPLHQEILKDGIVL